MEIIPRDTHIDVNFKEHVFYHGVRDFYNVFDIAKQGFRAYDEDVQCYRGGNLGNGIYLTCNWKIAVWFGNTLLRVSLREGTRIINTSQPPDMQIIRYLKKEFGAGLVQAANVRKIIPGNKQLTLPELVALTRYHYIRTWEKRWRGPLNGWWCWPAKRERHLSALNSCISLMKQYGFHGYGNPADDNGLLIFSPERIVLQEIVAMIPIGEYGKSYQNIAYDEHVTITLEALRAKYHTTIEELGRNLNEVAADGLPMPRNS